MNHATSLRGPKVSCRASRAKNVYLDRLLAELLTLESALLRFPPYTGFLLAVCATTIGFEGVAHASGGDEAPQAPSSTQEPPARIAWGVRLNGSGGVFFWPESLGGVAGRVGLDGEYWLSKNIGVAAQLGFLAALVQRDQRTGTVSQLSLAPAVTIRGSNPTSFPTVSLAVGYSLAHTDMQTHCEPGQVYNLNCQPGSRVSDDSGFYASLIAAWMFHPGYARPASKALAFGPLVRVDVFTLPGIDYVWSCTTGLAIGLDGVSDGVK